MLPEPIAVTLIVIEVLETLNVPYLIGGSLASTSYGRVRTTMDSDLVADLQSQHVEPFVQVLSNAFYVDEIAMHNAIEQRSSLT